MALFNLKKDQKHFVQSFEYPEYEGIRIYFNGEDEKKSNTNMLGYLGKEEYEKIKFDPQKYKFIKNEMTESELKSIGINPNRTAHKIFTGPDEIKKEMKEIINIKNEIDEIENSKKEKLDNKIQIYEDKNNNIQSKNKINVENKEKEININLPHEQVGNSAKSHVSNSGKEIHIHINLGSSPHLEKAMLENQEAIKKLQEEFNKSLEDAKNTIKKMEEKLKDKNFSYSKSFSSNFGELTKPKQFSNAEIALENKKSDSKEIHTEKQKIEPIHKTQDNFISLKNNQMNRREIDHELPNLNTIDIIKKELDAMKDEKDKKIDPPVEPLPSHISDENKIINSENNTPTNISYNEAINQTKINEDDNLFFRGRYKEKDSIQGHTYEEVKNIYQNILKENYDKEIYSVEKKDNYSIIHNNTANKIQNYVVNKNKLDEVILSPDTPNDLKMIVEKYKNSEIEKTEENIPSQQKEETIEMR